MGGRVTSGVRAIRRGLFAAAVLVGTLLSSNAMALTGVGGDPIACFIVSQRVYGGAGSPNVTYTFDPNCSYLPTSPLAGQTYRYQFFWNFGDLNAGPIPEPTSILVVPGFGPGDAVDVLVPVSHLYSIDGNYDVTLRIDVSVVNVDGTVQPGPSDTVTQRIKVGRVNFPPTANLVNQSSPATGELPYTLTVSPSPSRDEDGFIIYTAIDWGDGSASVIAPNPPNDPLASFSHVYTSPGIYKVKLSVIDNGRIPDGTGLLNTPAPTDIPAALQAVITRQKDLVNDGTILFEFGAQEFDPRLMEDFFFIQIPGNLKTTKGAFKLNFANTNSDSIDLVFTPNLPIENLSNSTVNLTIAGIPAPLGGTPFQVQFTTDERARFQNAAQGLAFTFNGRKQILTLRLRKAALAAALGRTNTIAVNQNADVLVRFVVNGTLTLQTTVRFVYNSQVGRSGIGKKGQSFPIGD